MHTRTADTERNPIHISANRHCRCVVVVVVVIAVDVADVVVCPQQQQQRNITIDWVAGLRRRRARSNIIILAYRVL